MTGAITSYIDVAQVTLYAFWVFFAGLIFYLRREDKREGYPLESDRTNRTGRVTVQGFPSLPEPKTFSLPHGGTATVPSDKGEGRPIAAKPIGNWPGAPLEPTGNPMLDGVGPASYAQRADEPDLTLDGAPKIVPLRVASEFYVETRDPDPRGMEVIGGDRKVAGTVNDVWVDRSDHMIRYLEVEVPATEGSRRVLLPWNFCRVDVGRKRINVQAILARQFADVPALRNPDLVTLLEEDRILGYYGGGTLYATPRRQEPMV